MRRMCVLAGMLWVAGAFTGAAQTPASGVEAFNQKLEAATRSMDNAATLALWAEDGVSLLPGAEPLVGKAAIAAFLERVTAPLKGARMTTFEMQCAGVQVVGDVATEWCTEHQVVQLPGAEKPFDGRGRMLLVLRRGGDGMWMLEREMWAQG